ncbi:MAG: pentapeptide repeat-containing protein [Chitinophagaceae bacterium]|nr:MAG: pentapeptide repeat-containing protein [Chitinophagaceae bacterium]
METKKIKLQIKNRWTRSVLFEYEKEDNTIAKTLKQAVASFAPLRGADLSGAALRGADLRDTDLSDTDLRGADLRGADLRDTDLSDTALRGAELRGADLRDTDLRGADLRDTDLRGAELRGADLRDTDLRGADLSGAALRDTALRGAELRGAELEPIKNDMFIVLLHSVPEIAALKKAILNGKIDGSTYSGECCCLSGTVCKNAPTVLDEQRALRVRRASRPIERFFLGIKPGDTPDTNQFAKLASEWIEEFEQLLNTNTKH